MEELLRIVIEPASTSTEVEMDPEKLKFFMSKLKIWDYAKISAFEFQNLSFEDKSKIVSNYYANMPTKYLVNSVKSLFFCYLFLFIFVPGQFLRPSFKEMFFVCYSSQCSASTKLQKG